MDSDSCENFVTVDCCFKYNSVKYNLFHESWKFEKNNRSDIGKQSALHRPTGF